ncbi:arabinose ABC transporter L-arabinose-binding periplasmic protein AraF [Actinobacillus ureae]|uniref:Periplasmic binding protein/LacI sugar binding domain-containing protein n=1 Tax=Actinobacillus ureae ATCC 25976 TaxID=887324 RepID=E8KHX5_9PAST|nr:hypothetical protein HMPREF0027_1442 [Actinobacillus ureae ATCC 25976]SUT86516.1 arabinose ABC transporter L-arabinose-binding periplasmic protein AraF [Actinobacillus ureae]SUU46126.1 arabinose ABC transporter L-arabinose-binding periplasmic protein AraF [Actinobacillus ureae]
MKTSKRTFLKSLLAVSILAISGLHSGFTYAKSTDNLKLGFLVKQPEEPWFQTEWRFADKAAQDLGDVEIIKIAVPDGEKTLNAIDNLAANGAKGFVICTPNPKLGPAIMQKLDLMI